MLLALVVVSIALWSSGCAVDLSFPPGFLFGSATSAYQVEGAWNVSDKGESIWDRFTHSQSGNEDGSTGDVATDSYHQWERDMEVAANLSLDYYRFSLSWTRILPNGFANYISEDGKRYYNQLIDGLLAKGIQPVVTIYHWDLPQRLQDLGGWTNPYITDWFADYADVVFSLFGDRVKTWITINEPMLFCDGAYTNTFHLAPGVVDREGVYLCGKNAMVAHGKAYRVYQKKYKAQYNGKLSLSNQLVWYEASTEEDEVWLDIAQQYSYGRFSHPIYSKEGGWPPVIEDHMRNKSSSEGFHQSRLPEFTDEEKELVKGTFDFYAINHYTSRAVRKRRPGEPHGGFPLTGAPDLDLLFERRPDWTEGNEWLYIYPEGLRRMLGWLRDQYGDIPILITENGFSTAEDSLEDHDRVQYYRRYLEQVLLAIKEDGVNVIGYTAWSLIDNFEWMDGYKTKFGLCHVNFSDPLRTRTLRRSGRFYADVIKRRTLDLDSDYRNYEF
ncbi:myrosinase 1-like isoform X1 [Ostrinia nubilalis]|uniref:myrosinase 1-like isoform X1 n=1 Tax=Ostrinia nubilalis TaxID=29057 RepID=UPI0030822475